MTETEQTAPKPRRGRPPRARAEDILPPAVDRAFEMFKPPPPAEVPVADVLAGGGEARGPITPAQWDDDGWGGLPVQMRG